MSNIVFAGNLTADPELKYTPQGKAVVNATVAVTPREKDGDTWKDGEAAFYRIAVWGQDAEHFAASAGKGVRVLVQGVLKPRQYDKDGQTRTSLDVQVTEIGLSVKFKAINAMAESVSASYGDNTDPWAQVASGQEPPY